MKILKEPKIIFAFVCIVLAIIVLRPTPVQGPTGTMQITTALQLGLDMAGGVRAIIVPENATKEIVDKSISVLETRLNAYGLKEAPMSPIKIGDRWAIQLELAGSTSEQLKELLEKQGKFEGFINREVKLSDGKGALKFNGKDYSLTSSDSTITLNEKTLSINDSVQVEGVDLVYLNKSDSTITLNARVLSGTDILQIFRDVEHSRISQVTGGWQFQFTILTSNEAAERFAKTTKDMEVEFTGTRSSYLKGDINFYLDDKLVDSLRISSDLKGQVVTQPSIEGPGTSKEDARQKMMGLQAILEGGALPTAIKIESLNTVTAKLGAEFMQMALIAILLSLVAVSLTIFARYKDPKIVLPIIGTSGAEMLLTLSIVGVLLGQTIDLAAIAGLVVAVGTGVNDQIIITDETMAGKKEREEISIKRRIKNAFFIVFAAATTIIVAMLPLIFIGAGNLKGFGLTTIIGVLVGVIVTRPAYATFIEYIRR